MRCLLRHSLLLYIFDSIVFSGPTPSPKIKIVDYFPFNGEPMAFFRLIYLRDVVDLFIMTESRMTHSGKEKSTLYMDSYQSLLEPLEKTGKLKMFRIDFPSEIYTAQSMLMTEAPFRTESWAREMYQRNIGRNITLSVLGDVPFILLVSDADEIPKKEYVSQLRNDYDKLSVPLGFQMGLFYYSFKWLARAPWTGTYAINDMYLRRNVTSSLTLEQMRKLPSKPILHQAGWHCSYCMSSSAIANKLRSFAHTEYNTTRYQSVDWIDNCRRTGQDLFRRTGLRKSHYTGKPYGYPNCGPSCMDVPEFDVLELPPSSIS